MKKYDCCGWATRNDLRCSDGRKIRQDAFKDDDGKTVPVLYQHNHADPEYVLGHALLENRTEGVFAFVDFNETRLGKHVKELVRHGDVCSFSIYANNLKQSGGDVLHGCIKELSIVLAGANPGATIVYPAELEHSDGEDYDENALYIYPDMYPEMDEDDDNDLSHEDKEDPPVEKKPSGAKSGQRTPQEIFDGMMERLSEEEKNVLMYVMGQMMNGEKKPEAAKHGDDEGETLEHSDKEGDDETMRHNVFDNEETSNSKYTLSHADVESIFKRARSLGSLQAAAAEFVETLNDSLAHSANEHGVEESAGTATYGIDGIEWLYPEDHELNTPPKMIDRDQTWVSKVMNGVHHSPFSRVKTTFADITEDDARALGYIKGNMKKDEVFTLLRRSTDPQTVYKRQKMDRDDIIDITDFDVVSWIKGEMRGKLNEELARAFLIGDGRLSSSEDKISEDHIRSVYRDDDLFVIRKQLAEVAGEDKATTLIETVIRAWKDYRGAGNCVMFTTEDWVSDMLLLKDGLGHYMYSSVSQLATMLRVREIVTVPVMSATTTTRTAGGKTYKPCCIILNLNDYNVGADKGGAINLFDDFDIDYNQYKYLIETRCSGALVTPYSAIVVEEEVTA